jgi:hypothetical protein
VPPGVVADVDAAAPPQDLPAALDQRAVRTAVGGGGGGGVLGGGEGGGGGGGGGERREGGSGNGVVWAASGVRVRMRVGTGWAKAGTGSGSGSCQPERDDGCGSPGHARDRAHAHARARAGGGGRARAWYRHDACVRALWVFGPRAARGRAVRERAVGLAVNGEGAVAGIAFREGNARAASVCVHVAVGAAVCGCGWGRGGAKNTRSGCGVVRRGEGELPQWRAHGE